MPQIKRQGAIRHRFKRIKECWTPSVSWAIDKAWMKSHRKGVLQCFTMKPWPQKMIIEMSPSFMGKAMKNECLCHVDVCFITFKIALITAFQLLMILHESRIIESLNARRIRLAEQRWISRVELIWTRNQELRLLLKARNTRDGCGMNRMLSGNLNLFKEDWVCLRI